MEMGGRKKRSKMHVEADGGAEWRTEVRGYTPATEYHRRKSAHCREWRLLAPYDVAFVDLPPMKLRVIALALRKGIQGMKRRR